MVYNPQKKIQYNHFNFFKNLTLIIFLLSLLTIFLGPLVRAEDAGLACPDWPLCHGYVIPPLDYQIYLEFIHRVSAGILGVIFIVWFFYGIFKKNIRKKFLPYILLTGFMLVNQILLGRETITRQLNAYIVKFHLLNAILLVSVFYYIFYIFNVIQKKGNYISKTWHSESEIFSFYIQFFILLIFVYIQIFLGGRVSANYAGLVCNEFPECFKVNHLNEINNIYLPELIGSIEYHISHRFMGFFVFAYALYLFYFSLKRKFYIKESFLILSIVIFQISTGILNIVFELPTITRIIHSFTATILFLVILHCLLNLNLEKQWIKKK